MPKGFGSCGRFLLSAVAAIFLFSCASSPKVTPVPDKQEEDDTGDYTVVEISIPKPKPETRSFFYQIPDSVMAMAENGSPESLKQAYSILHKTLAEEYSESEKVLLKTISMIMQIAWPTEMIAMDIPKADTNNSYLGAIDSAVRGIYDSSTGNADFLALILPSLVLLTSNTRDDYYDLAEASIKKALSLKNTSVLANYLYAVLLYRRGEYNRSMVYFDNSWKSSPSSFELSLYRIRALAKCGDDLRVLEYAEPLLENNPQHRELLKLCAQSSFNLNYMEKAEGYVVRVLLLESDNLEYVLFRARILMGRGDYIRASSLLDVYSRSDTENRVYLFLRGSLQYHWNKNTMAAAETVSRGLSLYPGDMELLELAAEIASSGNMNIGELKAGQIASSILEKDPGNVKASEILISECIKEGQLGKAYELSSAIIGRLGQDSNSIYNHIDICLSLKHNREALEYAEKKYSSDPKSEDARQAYIKVLVADGQSSLALSLINQFMPESSSKMKSFLYCQRSYFGATEDAVLNDLRSSLTAFPRNRESLYRLYEIYYNKSDWRRAQYYLKQVVALDPANRQILEKNSELDRLLGK